MADDLGREWMPPDEPKEPDTEHEQAAPEDGDVIPDVRNDPVPEDA